MNRDEFKKLIANVNQKLHNARVDLDNSLAAVDIDIKNIASSSDRIISRVESRQDDIVEMLKLLAKEERQTVAAKDIFHQTVRLALEKDGWSITDDPLYINFAEVEFYVDLGAEKLLAAEKNEQKIAVEIKTFLNPSTISEFHKVVGQFLNYRFALKAEDPERVLYLAIPKEIYETFFARRFVRLIIQEYQLKLIIFNPTKEEIEEWKN